MSRQRFPRQSAPSSGGAASSSDATVSDTITSGGTDTITSSLAATTGPTSGFSSPSTSSGVNTSPPSSEPTTPTATSSSPGTTSTPQSTPTSQSSSSSVLSTSSLTPTSSSSVAPSTTSSAASPSSSEPPSTITQPPTPSQQGTPTTITSSYTTYVNGSALVTQTSFPSTIPAPPGSSSGNRAAIIGGSAAGGTVVLILLLSIAFFARRKRFKRLNFLNAIRLRRNQIRSRATLFDDEDLTDVDLRRPPHRYTDYETPWDASESGNDSDRTRALPGPSRSDTRSALREDVWPPPHEGTRLIDPLANRDDLDLDLGQIVDDVMGPSSAAVHFSDRSVSSMYRDSVAVSEGAVHSRTVSNASNAALLEAAGLGGASGVTPPTAPVRSSPLAQSETEGRNAS